MVPQPRTPRCYRHTVWMANCADCAEAHKWEQEQARKRLAEAAR